jgi:hypothetical protein
LSICVVSVNCSDRAFIAVDTVCQSLSDGEIGEHQKLYLMPHAGIALAGIGMTGIAAGAHARLLRAGRGVDFDFVAPQMPEILADCVPASMSARAFARGTIVWLVGWSRAYGCMVAHAFSESDGMFDRQIITTWSAYPFDFSSDEFIPAPHSTDGIEARALQAIEHGRATHPDCEYGGRLVLAEITRDSMRTEIRQLKEPA